MSEQVDQFLASNNPSSQPAGGRDPTEHGTSRLCLVLGSILGAVAKAIVVAVTQQGQLDLVAILTPVCISLVATSLAENSTIQLHQHTPGWVQMTVGFSVGFVGPSVLMQVTGR